MVDLPAQGHRRPRRTADRSRAAERGPPHQRWPEDGNLLAYSVRQGGEDETEIHILDVRKRQGLGKRDAGKRLYYHALVPGAANDTEVFGEGFGRDTWSAPVTSENGRYLLIVVQHGWAKGELYFQDLSGSGPPRPGNWPSETASRSTELTGFLHSSTNWNCSPQAISAVPLHRCITVEFDCHGRP